MAHTAFFAWQLDTPAEQNKMFIWKALSAATSSAASSVMPEESPRPETDTGGVAGSPNIVETIFKRIRDCAFFIADLTFTAKTDSGKLAPNSNVLIELGYAARSIGWERTILVLNQTYGKAKHLPFDILQHRWPIEYRMSERTIVGERRFDHLSDALAAAITSCEQHVLTRADEMADSLDTATIDIISQYENTSFIDMRLPSKTMGELLVGLDHILAIRQLISIGALRVTHMPTIGYKWTYDGRRMIEALVRKQPKILEMLRMHRQEQTSR
jgi:hypothetical protein